MTREDPRSGADAAVASAADRVDEQEEQSFPASDPHSDWSGPPEPETDGEEEAGE